MQTAYLICMKKDITDKFAANVFDYKKMRKYLPKRTYNAIKTAREQGGELSKKDIEIYATALKKWAIKKGARRYAHWFQPLNNFTAGKRDSLYSVDSDGNAVYKFRAKELINGEGDASSFPNGGMRQTFEARGITKWDYAVFPFIKGNCLRIPTTFCGAYGEKLDKKSPLIKSSCALNGQAVKLLKLLGFNSNNVYSVVGAEQEYFLIDRNLYKKRKDLVYTGRTLFGAKPCKGQEFDDHYFRPPTNRVIAYMNDVDKELWALGIIAKTEHNEVAPCQYELAPCYSKSNEACDQNQIIMETLCETAEKHGFKCLLHEKPFENISGSGKHNNWSLKADTLDNLLEQGATPQRNALFLLIITAVIKAVDDYNNLLIASVSSAANDMRLGGYEAPPQILTVFLGETLSDIFENIVSGNFTVGKDLLPPVITSTDRNRTSPFAFCGNKFEFRMVGSSQSIADVNTVLNTIVAESFRQFNDKLEKSNNVFKDVNGIIAETYSQHKRVIFNGNGYSDEWIKEAHKRGFTNASAAQSLADFSDVKNIELFERHKVLNGKELIARKQILLNNYCNTVRLESIVTCEIYQRQIVPAIESYVKELTTLAMQKSQLNLDCETEQNKIMLLDNILKKSDKLAELILTELEKENNDVETKAKSYSDTVLPTVSRLRALVNEAEKICPKSNWPLPTYGQLLFGEK